jgi:hypothetical protein
MPELFTVKEGAPWKVKEFESSAKSVITKNSCLSKLYNYCFNGNWCLQRPKNPWSEWSKWDDCKTLTISLWVMACRSGSSHKWSTSPCGNALR